MPRLTRRLPSYRLHKPSGQAVVTLSGRDHYLGPHGSPDSRDKYDRLLAEWLASNRRAQPSAGSGAEAATPDLRVGDLVLAFTEHAESRYTKDGRPGREVESRIIRGDFVVAHQLLRRAMLQGGELREPQALSVVRGILGRKASEDEISQVTIRVVRRLVEDGLMELRHTVGGILLTPHPALTEHRVDAWTAMAVFPRAIVVAGVALIWVISPLDLMPDSLPTVGVLDDVVVSILGFGVLNNALKHRRIDGTPILSPLAVKTTRPDGDAYPTTPLAQVETAVP